MSIKHGLKSEAAKGEVIDFDEALLNSCPAKERADLMTEASMLAQAFAPERRAEELSAIARTLSAGARDSEMDRAHARRLAAALRRLAVDRP